MLTREELKGSWNQLKGQIRERWGQITNDELQQVHGDGEQLLGFLQKKTGQSRQELEKFLQEAFDSSQGLMERGRRFAEDATEGVKQYAQQASSAVQEGYASAEQQLTQGLDEAKHMVRSRPIESLSTAFGAGLITGILASLLLGGSRRA